MVVKRRRAVLALVATVFTALALAVAPVYCSESSADDRPSCTTFFGYASPLP